MLKQKKSTMGWYETFHSSEVFVNPRKFVNSDAKKKGFVTLCYTLRL